MCDHKFALDNERVSLKTAERLGWYFCIRCGLQVPNDKVRYAPLEPFYFEPTKTAVVKKAKTRRVHVQKKNKLEMASEELPLQDELWTDPHSGKDYIISPDGQARRYTR